ncbi:MAG TPA: aminoglycoside adenylyltransferase domain-containing protein [Ktedonobacterales bacterium]|nr:aminoglycoside adenylyltransferase domain-containing protein [Ktedonobacterales bacterium]
MTMLPDPTPDADLNGVLRELVLGVQAVLGENFIGAYLQGSFAVGDWDSDSDIDWVIAVERDISDADLPTLQALHVRLHRLASPWAQHLEGSYIPRAILKRRTSARHQLLFLGNTADALERSDHDDTQIVRWVTREYGIALAGPAPATLIAPVSADDLRQEVRETMREWAEMIRTGTYRTDNRWAQPFVVLSYCRMLHTLQTGRVASKLAGAQWAMRTLDPRWAPLIQRAWNERPNPSLKVRQPADPDDQRAMLAFIHYALARSRLEEDL